MAMLINFFRWRPRPGVGYPASGIRGQTIQEAYRHPPEVTRQIPEARTRRTGEGIPTSRQGKYLIFTN
jgi:hypothetical protein